MSNDTENQLWCMHVPGPDDLWPMPSKEAAELAAAKHNKWVVSYYERNKHMGHLPTLENMKARVIVWPYSAEEHAEELAKPDAALMATQREGE